MICRFPAFSLALLLMLGGGLFGAWAFQAAAEEVEARFEIFYSLEAQVRTRRLDADLRAGGRLLMTGRRIGESLVLMLARPLEPPWKLYWVDPAGPFGEEVKLATVVTLPEGSWEALAAARAMVLERGRREYESWREQAERPAPFDGAFAFVVIGPAAGRFEVEIGSPDVRVRNLLTDRWLSGPFGALIETWSRRQGYWFWNEGETEPFVFEPHTYHALSRALDLLALPTAPDNGGTNPVVWRDVKSSAASVLSTLAPKARKSIDLRRDDSLTLELEKIDGRTVMKTRGGNPLATRWIARGPSGEVESDCLRLHWVENGLSLDLQVGYTPFGSGRAPCSNFL